MATSHFVKYDGNQWKQISHVCFAFVGNSYYMPKSWDGTFCFQLSGHSEDKDLQVLVDKINQMKFIQQYPVVVTLKPKGEEPCKELALVKLEITLKDLRGWEVYRILKLLAKVPTYSAGLAKEFLGYLKAGATYGEALILSGPSNHNGYKYPACIYDTKENMAKFLRDGETQDLSDWNAQHRKSSHDIWGRHGEFSGSAADLPVVMYLSRWDPVKERYDYGGVSQYRPETLSKLREEFNYTTEENLWPISIT